MIFKRDKKRAEAVTDFYEACFEDFQTKTHKTIRSLTKQIIIMERYFELISDLAYDCDGLNEVDSLKGLINELEHYANLGRACNTSEMIYVNNGVNYNILHEPIKESDVK